MYQPKRRWVTLRNHRRVQIDQDGRIVRGVARDARGVHVRDVAPFMATWRDLESTDCSRSSGGYCYRRKSDGSEVVRDQRDVAVPQRFSSKDQAVEALLAANPHLFDFVQENWGSDSQAYKNWVLAGRRGRKPQLGPGDGRFDALNVRFNLTGTRRCSSFVEALYVTVPSSHRWEDLTPDRLEPLSECVGFAVEPPEESLVMPLARGRFDECEDVKGNLRRDLLETAKRGRLSRSDVPF